MTASLFTVFSFSFLVALTGALAPGPLLTYTIIRSARAERRGYLMGIWIIAGHAVIELVIIVALLSGFSLLLKNVYVMRSIGVAGGLLLVGFGISIIRDTRSGGIDTGLPEEMDGRLGDSGLTTGSPMLGGMLVSMSNPYWWVWWATIGLAFMVEFNISLTSFPELAVFFVGHELGDLAWYLVVSALAFYGIRRLNRSVYHAILLFCGIFMIGFGVYLGISPFFDLRAGS